MNSNLTLKIKINKFRTKVTELINLYKNMIKPNNYYKIKYNN